MLMGGRSVFLLRGVSSGEVRRSLAVGLWTNDTHLKTITMDRLFFAASMTNVLLCEKAVGVVQIHSLDVSMNAKLELYLL